MIAAAATHSDVHALTLPTSMSGMHASDAVQDVGQEVSQVSPPLGSITPLPQTALQSESLVALPPDGQQPSLGPMAVMSVSMQRAVQLAEDPTLCAALHDPLGVQFVGHGVGLPLPSSQNSLASI